MFLGNLLTTTPMSSTWSILSPFREKLPFLNQRRENISDQTRSYSSPNIRLFQSILNVLLLLKIRFNHDSDFMRWSRKFCQRGSKVLFTCSWWGSKYHSKSAIIGPPAKRHLNGVSLACRRRPSIECWLGSFVIAKKPYILVIFPGGGGPDPLSPLCIRPWTMTIIKLSLVLLKVVNYNYINSISTIHQDL